MSKVITTSGDFYLIAQPGGTISFSTGASGKVSVSNNLEVAGTISSSGNILVSSAFAKVNTAETGSGITAPNNVAGLDISRGTLGSAQLVFDDSASIYDPVLGSNVTGTFTLRTVSSLGAINPSTLQVGTIGIDSATQTNLNFDLKFSPQFLQIVNSAGYEQLLYPLTDTSKDNAITNRKFVTQYVTDIINSGAANQNLNVDYVTSGTLAIVHGGTGSNSATGTGSVVLANNPVLTGTPTLNATLAWSDNSKNIANTEFVQSAVHSQFLVKSADFTADPNYWYWLSTTITVTLPDTSAGLPAGTYVRFSKDVSSAPVIQVGPGGAGIVTSLGTDTSVQYNIDGEIVVVYNGTNWEV